MELAATRRRAGWRNFSIAYTTSPGVLIASNSLPSAGLRQQQASDYLNHLDHDLYTPSERQITSNGRIATPFKQSIAQ